MADGVPPDHAAWDTANTPLATAHETITVSARPLSYHQDPWSGSPTGWFIGSVIPMMFTLPAACWTMNPLGVESVRRSVSITFLPENIDSISFWNV